MISFDYSCDGCGDNQTNMTLESFICSCGGQYRLVESVNVEPSTFEPHYVPEIKQMVYSWKDAEKKGREFRSADHPHGFVLANANTKMRRDMRYLRKHKEDFIQQQYAKDGLRYKPGSNTRRDDNTNRFIPASR